MKALKIAAALLLFSGLASAAPCTLGFIVQPSSPVAGQPVSISYSGPYLGFVVAPSTAIEGNQITIDQPTVHADPAALGDVPCGQRLVQVGALPAGNYSLLIHLSSFPQMSGSFVVSPATVAVCGVADSLVTGPGTGTAAVSVSTDHGSVMLHFQNESFADSLGEGAFPAPWVGTPQARLDGSQIKVTQTYTPGPSRVGQNALFCQREDVDLGTLPPGSYKVIWTYLTGAGEVSVTSSFNNGSSPRGRSVRSH